MITQKKRRKRTRTLKTSSLRKGGGNTIRRPTSSSYPLRNLTLGLGKEFGKRLVNQGVKTLAATRGIATSAYASMPYALEKVKSGSFYAISSTLFLAAIPILVLIGMPLHTSYGTSSSTQNPLDIPGKPDFTDKLTKLIHNEDLMTALNASNMENFQFENIKVIVDKLKDNPFNDDKILEIAKQIFVSILKVGKIIEKDTKPTLYGVNNAAYIKTRSEDIKKIVAEIEKTRKMSLQIGSTSRPGSVNVPMKQYEELITHLTSLLAICEYENRRNHVLKTLLMNLVYALQTDITKGVPDVLSSSNNELKQAIGDTLYDSFSSVLTNYIDAYNKMAKSKDTAPNDAEARAFFELNIQLVNSVRDMINKVEKGTIESITTPIEIEVDIHDSLEAFLNLDQSEEQLIFITAKLFEKQLSSLTEVEITNECKDLVALKKATTTSSMWSNKASRIEKLESKKREFIHKITNKEKDAPLFNALKEYLCNSPFTEK